MSWTIYIINILIMHWMIYIINILLWYEQYVS